MNAFIAGVAKLPRWSLPIIMVVPVIIIMLTFHYTSPYVRVVIDDQHVGLMIDPNTTDCEARGSLMKDGSGCVINQYLGAGAHDVLNTYRVELYDLRPITIEYTIGGSHE